MPPIYSTEFFENRAGSLLSARHIVPLVLGLIKPKSVVDVGCGTGDFLSVFYEKGIHDICGVDGPWVDKKNLRIPDALFLPTDLTKPLNLHRTFDLAVSLEVAEHLDQKFAKTFIHSLTRLSPVVLFSAAIPFQGGVHHVNEQWPEYWASLFEREGYLPIDCIRRAVWDNPEVSVWYAQNSFLFVSRNHLTQNSKLQLEWERSKGFPFSMVHPKLYLPKAKIFDRLLKLIPSPLQRLFTKLKNAKIHC